MNLVVKPGDFDLVPGGGGAGGGYPGDPYPSGGKIELPKEPPKLPIILEKPPVGPPAPPPVILSKDIIKDAISAVPQIPEPFEGFVETSASWI